MRLNEDKVYFWYDYYNGFMATAFTFGIAIMSGLGMFYLEFFYLGRSLVYSLIFSFAMGSGLALVYFLAEYKNYQRKKKVKKLEDQKEVENCEKQ